MQGILCGVFLLLLIAGLVAFWSWCINIRSLHPLAIVVGNRCYLCGHPFGHPLGTLAPMVFDKPGKVFLADGSEIMALHKRELQTRLSSDELGAVQKRLRTTEKICVVRNHELAQNLQKWLDYWSGWATPVRRSNDSRKDDIVVSPL